MIQIRENCPKDDHRRRTITADTFGPGRTFNLLRNKVSEKPNEIFFSVEYRKGDKNFVGGETGYVEKTPELEEFIKNNFFTGCNGVRFIQWTEDWNVVFNEASIIGNVSCQMSNEEFDKFIKSLKEVETC